MKLVIEIDLQRDQHQAMGNAFTVVDTIMRGLIQQYEAATDLTSPFDNLPADEKWAILAEQSDVSDTQNNILARVVVSREEFDTANRAIEQAKRLGIGLHTEEIGVDLRQ